VEITNFHEYVSLWNITLVCVKNSSPQTGVEPKYKSTIPL